MAASDMTFQEKTTWLYGVVSVVTGVTYFAIVGARARGVPAAEVDWVWPMVWTMVGCLVAMILGTLAIYLLWSEDRGRADQRDREIERYGNHVGQIFATFAAVAALILAMTEASHFWIANAIFIGCFLSGFLGSLVKIVVYRTGFER
ncbi:MAG: hypothetical protein JW990_04395 [Thermoleophilia bacterium]|nr:hypothetical protein [Thermoleophilia bacterium]